MPSALLANPYNGHTLADQLAQTNSMLDKIGVKPTTAVVDLGFQQTDQNVAPMNVIHRGKYKTLAPKEKRWLKRRQAIAPMIGAYEVGQPYGLLLAEKCSR